MIGLVGANGVVRHEGVARRSILLGKADPAAAVSCTRMCGPSRRDMASTLRVTFICGNGFCMLFAEISHEQLPKRAADSCEIRRHLTITGLAKASHTHVANKRKCAPPPPVLRVLT